MDERYLQSGMIVELKSGLLYMVYKSDGKLVMANEYDAFSLDYYNEGFKEEGFTIVKVRKPKETYQFKNVYWNEAPVIWERKEIKLTEEEKALIKSLDIKYKWIARNHFGDVVVFEEKPKRYKVIWLDQDYSQHSLSGFNENVDFDFLSWESDEPTNLDELRELIEVE